MTTLIAVADGNLTGSTTFAAAEIGASALQLVRGNNGTLSNNTNATSSSFTVTTGKVIDGVLLWVYLLQTVGTTSGTFKVDLQKGGVSQASVTVNRADLPDNNQVSGGAPCFFKFTSTATGDGGANWTIVITNNIGAGSVAYAYVTTSANFCRALRTTTTATPAAADDLYVVGELTGAGTHNSRAVTMNSTAATAYGNGSVNSTSVSGGGIRVASYGALSYGTTASTNYLLRVNGDVEVHWNGTLDIGSSGSEIPRNSTAVLEFQQVSADCDFGLRILNSGTLHTAGLSRTSGKNIVKCKLTANLTGSAVLTAGPTTTNGTNTALAGIDATGFCLLASTFADTVTNATHSVAFSGSSITNTTQVALAYLARGSGTNNRFVRMTIGNNTAFGSVTNGLFVDIDLQAGTVGTATAIGNGTATSTAITPVGGGYVVTLTGKCSSGAATPSVLLNACSASGTTSFAGAGNQCFIYDDVQLVTAASISTTTLSVDTDTGWLSGDVVAVASTTRTPSDTEPFVLNADAGASSLTSIIYPFGAGGPTTTNWAGTHHGTSPVQAEIGLLTRNVKVRSTSSTLMTYVFCSSLAVVSSTWTEFYYMGSLSNGKRGFEMDNTGSGVAGVKSITFCSLHDFDANGFYISSTNGATSSLQMTFSNNICFNTYSQPFLTLASIAPAGEWTISGNLVMRASGAGFSLSSMTGTFTNNTAVGCGSGIVTLDATTPYTIMGTFSGNTFHSNTSQGVSISTANALVGTMASLSCWRNNGVGVLLSVGSGDSIADFYFDSLTLFGNNVTNISLGTGVDSVNITGSSVICGDTTFATTFGINAVSIFCTLMLLDISGVDFSGVGGIYAPHVTADFSPTNSTYVSTFRGSMNNCKFGATPLSVKTNWAKSNYIGMERYGQTAGDHRTELTYGQLKTDTTIFNTASPSMRMTPNNASNKLESAPRGLGWKIPVSSGNTAAIAAYVYKSKTGDGAAYNGNQPRLIQRANPALGQTSDVVLATYSSSTGSWNQLSANTSTATDDGAWEIIVDCDGTAGWINVDDLQVA